MNTETQSEQLIMREEIPNTPFIIVTTEGQSFLTVGRYRVSPMMETPEDVQNYLQSNMWEVIFTLINCVNDAYSNFNQQPAPSTE